MGAAEIVLAKAEDLLSGQRRNHQSQQTSSKPDTNKKPKL